MCMWWSKKNLQCYKQCTWIYKCYFGIYFTATLKNCIILRRILTEHFRKATAKTMIRQRRPVEGWYNTRQCSWLVHVQTTKCTTLFRREVNNSKHFILSFLTNYCTLFPTNCRSTKWQSRSVCCCTTESLGWIPAVPYKSHVHLKHDILARHSSASTRCIIFHARLPFHYS